MLEDLAQLKGVPATEKKLMSKQSSGGAVVEFGNPDYVAAVLKDESEQVTLGLPQEN